MFYKLNLFLREWEGYEKVYNFFKTNKKILILKFLLYLLSFVLIFFDPRTLFLYALKVMIYMPLTIMEYFSGHICYEKGDKFTAYLSYILVILNFINFTLNLSMLISGI